MPSDRWLQINFWRRLDMIQRGLCSDQFMLRAIRVVLVCVFCLFTLLIVPVQLYGQVENGISGTVEDASGEIIVGASVVVTNASTGVVSRATTTSQGTFTVVGLLP